MNDFDRFLEFELRRMLDPVVASGPPRRRRRRNNDAHLLVTVVKAPLDLAVEPMAIPVSVAP